MERPRITLTSAGSNNTELKIGQTGLVSKVFLDDAELLSLAIHAVNLCKHKAQFLALEVEGLSHTLKGLDK